MMTHTNCSSAQLYAVSGIRARMLPERPASPCTCSRLAFQATGNGPHGTGSSFQQNGALHSGLSGYANGQNAKCVSCMRNERRARMVRRLSISNGINVEESQTNENPSLAKKMLMSGPQSAQSWKQADSVYAARGIKTLDSSPTERRQHSVFCACNGSVRFNMLLMLSNDAF